MTQQEVIETSYFYSSNFMVLSERLGQMSDEQEKYQFP